MYILNVTSLEWLDTSRAYSSAGLGTKWSHIVHVVVPADLYFTNISNAFLSFGDNAKPNNVQHGDAMMADAYAKYSGQISINIMHIPNAPIKFPSDPRGWDMSEDDLLSWAWKQYFNDPKKDPEWLPHLPMVKGAFQCMRAA